MKLRYTQGTSCIQEILDILHQISSGDHEKKHFGVCFLNLSQFSNVASNQTKDSVSLNLKSWCQIFATSSAQIHIIHSHSLMIFKFQLRWNLLKRPGQNGPPKIQHPCTTVTICPLIQLYFFYFFLFMYLILLYFSFLSLPNIICIYWSTGFVPPIRTKLNRALTSLISIFVYSQLYSQCLEWGLEQNICSMNI